MTSDENFLISKFGKRQPFRVPDVYFESLSKTIDKRIEQDVQCCDKSTTKCRLETKHSHLGIYATIASVAAVVGLVVVVELISGKKSDSESVATQTEMSAYTTKSVSTISCSTDYDETMADCSMLDNDQIYSLVASN